MKIFHVNRQGIITYHQAKKKKKKVFKDWHKNPEEVSNDTGN